MARSCAEEKQDVTNFDDCGFGNFDRDEIGEPKGSFKPFR